MIHVVNKWNEALYREEMEQAYRLRHRVFVEECGWEDIRSSDERDIDQFDTDSAIHLLAMDAGKVVGYSRLLPTIEPHLLTDVYPHLSAKPIPQDENIFEWTRYCITPEKRGGSAVGNVGCHLLCGVTEYAQRIGLSHLTMETDPIWITRFTQLGFDVDPLGLPQTIGGEPVIAMTIEITDHAVEKARRMLRVRGERLVIPPPDHPQEILKIGAMK